MSRESEHDGALAVRRARAGVLAAAILTALVAMLLVSPGALALSQRGHEPAFSFAGFGEGAGQLKAPRGVAVSQSTGKVYVVDSANNRVDVFSSNGQFVEMWGWGVLSGEKKLQRCKEKEAKEAGCKAGMAGKGKFELEGAEQIAVDNSTSPSDLSKGDVYVEANTSEEHAQVAVFGPSGEEVAAIKGPEKEEKFEELRGIGVDPTNGDLLVYNEEEIFRFAPGEKHELVGVQSSEFSNPRPGLAADAEGHYYIGHALGEGAKSPTVFGKLDTATEEPLIEELDTEESTGVAVDSSAHSAEDPFGGDVYVDNVGKVSVFSPSGALLEQFGQLDSEEAEAEPEGEPVGKLKHGSGVAVNPASAHGLVYVADAELDTIDVYRLEGPHKPQVDEEAIQKITTNSAELGTQINPRGASTSFVVRLQPAGEAQVPGVGQPCVSPCLEAPQGHEEHILGESFGDQSRSVVASGLEAGTEYRYLVLAKNAHGESAGVEQSFRTQLTAGGLKLADGRAWQLVSPPAKNAGSIEAITKEGGVIQASGNGGAVTYVSSAPLEHAEVNRAPEFTQILSRRGENEWSSTDVSTPVDKAEGVKPGLTDEYRLFSSDLSLGLLQPYGGPIEEPPISAESSERSVFVRENSICETAAEGVSYIKVPGCYQPLVSPANVHEGTKYGGALNIVGTTPDVGHVVLQTARQLTAAAIPAGESLYEWSKGAGGSPGSLALVSVLPEKVPGEETPAPTSGLGSGITVSSGKGLVRQAISAEGRRVVWSGTNTEFQAHLYMRDMQLHQTIQLDVQEAGVKEVGTPQAKFQTASADGKRIFFTDRQQLTTNSSANSSKEKADLYECEVVEEGGHAKCKLSDLTGTGVVNAEESADVRGILPGASEEGTTVYFVANGRMAKGAQSGRCHTEGLPSATCNLYVERYSAQEEKWLAPVLVAVISEADEPDFQEEESVDLGHVTSRVSPNGRYLAFMSDMPITGYNNHDVNSGAADEEVFLYDSQSANGPTNPTCVSCNPTGARPAGLFDTVESGEGQSPVVDRPKTWDERWIAGNVPGWTSFAIARSFYQSRYLSNEGRLFFNSAEGLVPQDINGKEDVYQYEPPGLGECSEATSTFSARSGGCVSLMSSGTSLHESAFLDASESGNDVFFITTSPLVKQDPDTSYDVYDAGVCGQPGSPECFKTVETPTPKCQAEPSAQSCRSETPAGSPPFGTPGSTGPSSNGTVPSQQVLPPKVVAPPPKAKPLTRAQKLALALKACRKKPKGKKRVACEKQARKAYGAKKAGKAKKARKASLQARASGRGTGR